ncbi:hypothetical protein [Xanthomonas sacchari]|uniref:hypothetical protein n=1 Tax=Xanthomonas TaxID=338 RepID=UPI00225E0421|nr:hypothetical protein [Xanthomonas sacchari]
MIVASEPQPWLLGGWMYGSAGLVEPTASLVLNGLKVCASLAALVTSGTVSVAPATSPLSSSSALASAAKLDPR